jgi:putative lipoprotein
MDQEAKFLAALKDVKGWRVDPARSKLLLLDVEGKTIVVLARN